MPPETDKDLFYGERFDRLDENIDRVDRNVDRIFNILEGNGKDGLVAEVAVLKEQEDAREKSEGRIMKMCYSLLAIVLGEVVVGVLVLVF